MDEGVGVRSFVVGQDEEAWVALNARAFADHPEQGRLTVADLRLRAGEYSVHIDVVGSIDGTVYASATTNTTSVPDAAISYSGALSGPTEQLLLSQTTLVNQGGRATQNVRIRITLSDAADAPLTDADAELFYQLGGDYQPLPLAEVGGTLQTWFGPGVGFALEDGHNATNAGAGLFHRPLLNLLAAFLL